MAIITQVLAGGGSQGWGAAGAQAHRAGQRPAYAPLPPLWGKVGMGGMRQSSARRLRKHPTDAERLLWCHLRLRQLGGYKFRRQQPLGPYIVDFVCLEQRLIVEVDGGQHAEQAKRVPLDRR